MYNQTIKAATAIAEFSMLASRISKIQNSYIILAEHQKAARLTSVIMNSLPEHPANRPQPVPVKTAKQCSCCRISLI